MILVGNKVDLRLEHENVDGGGLVDQQLAKHLADQIGSPFYIECSAKTRQNIDQVFNSTLQHVIKMKRKRSRSLRSRCLIL